MGRGARSARRAQANAQRTALIRARELPWDAARSFA